MQEDPDRGLGRAPRQRHAKPLLQRMCVFVYLFVEVGCSFCFVLAGSGRVVFQHSSLPGFVLPPSLIPVHCLLLYAHVRAHRRQLLSAHRRGFRGRRWRGNCSLIIRWLLCDCGLIVCLCRASARTSTFHFPQLSSVLTSSCHCLTV